MNVPKLRFKEFSGEWAEKQLKSLGYFIGGGTPSTKNINFWRGNIPWVSSSDLNDESIYEINKTRFISKEAVAQSATKLIPKNSILIVSRVGVGKVAVTDTELCTSQDFTNFIIDSDSAIFLAYLIKNKTFKLLEFNQGTSIKGFVKNDLADLQVYIPSLPEQTKISSFLTTIDEKIAQLTQKHALLNQYKKGMMQQIFSQKLRFKDENGEEFGEWEEKSLGEISDRNTKKNKDNTFNRVLTNSATQGIVSQQDYFDRDIANQNNLTGYYIVEKNNFVYNPRVSLHAPVGPIKRNHLGIGVMSPLYTVFGIKQGDRTFFEFYFETKLWHDYMKSVANTGARHDRMNITNSDFYLLPLPFPSIPEQTKIANFLSSIDQKINQVAAQLDATKQYKRGLLQQMFV